MKACSLNEFMQELKPWLDKDHIRMAEIDDKGRFVVHFLDNTKNVYEVTDCTKAQVEGVLKELRKKGISAE